MANADDKSKIGSDFVHLARLALTGRPQDVQLQIRRVAKRYRERFPEMSGQLSELLRDTPTRLSPLRKGSAPAIPVDLDSRLQLVRHEAVTELEVEPIFSGDLQEKLEQLAFERQSRERLEREGLSATRSALFTGPPGVGKSLAARWLARELGVPLLTLDLAAVMSSFLGRTGNNVRYVLDYAKRVDCILLLDELDAVAKRRDDATEVGELKRLVTVLLQEIDDWPEGGLLIAATNHSDLLDPAVWRRFEMLVDFPMPTDEAVTLAVHRFLGTADREAGWSGVLSVVLRGLSFSDIQRAIMQARRAMALGRHRRRDPFVELVQSRMAHLSRDERTCVAVELVSSGRLSQRQTYEMTGVSRDTIRKAMRDGQATDR